MFNFGKGITLWTQPHLISDLTGKSLQFDELFDYPAFWEQIWFNSKRKDRDLPEPVKLHQPHLIPGTVALADITEQTRVYHYNGEQQTITNLNTARQVTTLT